MVRHSSPRSSMHSPILLDVSVGDGPERFREIRLEI